MTMHLTPDDLDLLARIAALKQHFPEGTHDYDIVSIPVSVANVLAVGMLVERLIALRCAKKDAAGPETESP